MATKGLPSIPSIPGNISPDLYAVLSAIKTQIDFANNSTSTTNAVDQAQLEAAVANAVSGITKGDTGSPGSPGSNGVNGKSYVLDITGGRTSIIYDAAGSNPLPAMTAFGCQLYEDGVLVTPSSYSWFISDPANSLLSGTGSSATFTPTVAGTFNQAKGNNAVVLVVSYAGLSIRATEPIAITKVGAQGATGPTGPQGTAGTPGAPGTSSYFHVAYADSADGSVNFNQVSGSYIGTYVDSNPTDSALPSAYQWVLIKGAQGPTGNQGIPGTNGADGTTSYLHIKYSNDGGTTFTASGGETVGDYLGQYVDNTLLDSTNPADYTWALIKGADGVDGVNGTRTAILDLYQWAASTPTTFPSGTSTYTWETGQFTNPATLNGWSATPPAPVAGQILYIARQVYADSGTSATSSVTWSVSVAKPLSAAGTDGLNGSPGSPGSDGANGQRVGFLEVYKWAASAPTSYPAGTSNYTWATGAFTAPSTPNGWSLTPGAAVAGQTLWAISVNVSDNLTTATSTATWNSTTVYAVGAAGTNGANGKTYLLFITGGKTNAVYDADGLNPLPAPTAFGAELYEDGSLVTPSTFAWSVPASNSLLSGSETASTFTPTLASSFDAAKSDNRVLLTVTYNNGASTITAKAVQSIVISKQAAAGGVDTTPPGACDNLVVTGGVLYNFVTFDFPVSGGGNIDHIEVYRAAETTPGVPPARTDATVIGSTKVKMYLDYIPDGVGDNYYYWIRAISKAGVTGDWNLVSGVVSSAGTSAAPLAIGDSQVDKISANKIIAATLSAFSADLGTVTAGLLTSADNNFKIDLTDKSITIAGPAGLLADDYTLLKNGKVEFWKWTGSAHQQGQSLNTIESGTASNGSTVTLSKWYASIPNIIVTPNDTPIYNAANSAQSQKLQVRAENAAITAGGSVSFTAVSRLVLSGANPSIPVSDTYTGSSDSDTTNTITTSSNTTKIDVNISFSSKRGTGVEPNYYYRKVDARIAYRTSPSGAWSYTTWVTTNINADFNTYTASLTTGVLTSGTYDFYVEFLAADRGGTFENGSVTYTNSTVTRSLGASGVSGVNGNNSADVTYSFAAYSAPAGTLVDSTDYVFNFSHWLKNYGSAGKVTKVTDNQNGANKTVTFPTSPVFVSYSDGDGTLTNTTWTISRSSAGFNQSHSYNLFSNSPDTRSVAQLKMISATATINIRVPPSNDTTPANVFSITSYSLTLTGASVIDGSGTLNWMAIG